MNKALIFGLSAVACWSTVATAFKLGLEVMSPLPLVFWSATAGCIFLTLICFRKKLRLWESFKKHPLRFFIAGTLTPGCFYPLVFKAYELLPAQQAQSIAYSWTLMLTIMSWLFFKEKMRPSDWFYCTLGYGGVLIIASGGSLDFMQLESPMGLGLALLSTLFFAGYWILLRPVKVPPMASLTLCFICGWVVLFILMLGSGEAFTIADNTALIAATYIGLIEMTLGYSCWLVALQMTNCTAKLSNLMYLAPVISFILISQILGESILPSTIFGLIVILGSVFLQNRSSQGKTSDDTTISCGEPLPIARKAQCPLHKVLPNKELAKQSLEKVA